MLLHTAIEPSTSTGTTPTKTSITSPPEGLISICQGMAGPLGHPFRRISRLPAWGPTSASVWIRSTPTTTTMSMCGNTPRKNTRARVARMAMAIMGTAMVRGKEKEERNKAPSSSIHEGGSNLDADSEAISETFRGVTFHFLVWVSTTSHPAVSLVAFDGGIPSFCSDHLIKEVQNENTRTQCRSGKSP